MGLFKSVGGILNNLTGASSSAKQGYNYSTMLGAQNNAYQKEFAQNAHQWEMEDLKKAGLNPALTAAGGSGASAGGAGGIGNGSTGSPMGNIFEIMTGIAGTINQTKATNAQTELMDAQAIKTIAEADSVPQRIKNETMNAVSNRMNANINSAKAKTGVLGQVGGIEGGRKTKEFLRSFIKYK